MNTTIAAIATPVGVGALSIIRLSGEKAFEILFTIFSKDIRDKASHTAHFGKIVESDGTVIDEVIVVLMRGKRSFTGENSAEIICHGNPLVTQKILRRAFQAGAVPAEGGEFSKRAYLNGKIDLLQAEAIKEIIHAKNERALKEASRQLGGSLSVYIKDLQRCFIDLLAIIEVHIDYPEEGIEEATKNELLSMIESTIEKISRLAASFHDGKKLTKGYKVAILGAPNAGKSSLLNALLEEDRAIVTDIAGTTRDTIEEEITISGHTFTFVDTAGIRESSDEIERMGITRALLEKQRADIVILLVDSTKPVPLEIKELYSSLKDPLVVYNKQDVAEKNNPLLVTDPLYISAKLSTGLDSLKKALLAKVTYETVDETPILTKERHYQQLQLALSSLTATKDAIDNEHSVELISFDLREGLEHLAEIIGINVTEEILGGIFSKFCVGK